MTRNPSRLFAATTCAILLTCTSGAAHEISNEASGAAVLHTMQHEEFGEYIVGQEEMSVYLFEADRQGTQDAEPESTCHDDCALAWPPVLTEGDPEVHDELNPDLVGTISREDGSMQVTYNGWPLYRYAADYSAGHTRGHDIDEFGAEWYLVTPEGEKAGDH